MAEVIANIQGAEEALAGLKKLDDQMQAKVAKKSAKAGASLILGVSKAAAPRGQTGLLESEIQIRSANKPSKGVFKFTTGVSAKDWTGPAFYAGFLMWGYKAGSRKLGPSRKQVQGNDFLNGQLIFTPDDIPALENKSGDVLTRLFLIAKRVNGLSNSGASADLKN